MSTFVSPADVTALSLAQSSALNNLDAAVVTAFALIPDETLLNQGTVQFAVDTGAADAYLVAMPTALASYTDGNVVMMRTANANTGASTINVDSLGVKSIRRYDSSVLSANDILAGPIIVLRYSTNTGFYHTDPNATADATAAAASAAAAAISEANAAASESAAATSETNAAASASVLMKDPVWADLLQDGATAPDAAAQLTVSNKIWRFREFDHAQTEDANFPLVVPPGYGTIKYRVIGAITNATGPSSEGMAFTLAGYCSGDNDPLSQTYGTAVTVTKTSYTAIQNDLFVTDWSGAVTVTDIAEGELANFQFTRDHDHASDDYAQKVGVIAVIVDWSA